MAVKDRASRWRCVCYAIAVIVVWVFFSDNGAIRHRLFPKTFPTRICGVEVRGETRSEYEEMQRVLKAMAPALRFAITSIHMTDGPEDCAWWSADDGGHCHDDGRICVNRGYVNADYFFHEAEHAFRKRLHGGAEMLFIDAWQSIAGERNGHPQCGVVSDYGFTDYDEDAAELCGVCGDWLVNHRSDVDLHHKTGDIAFRWKLEFFHGCGVLTDKQFNALSALPLFQEE